MPWYQVAGMVLASAVSLIVVGRFFAEAFAKGVAAVMSDEIRDIHRALDELDRQNAHRFAGVDNALGEIQAQFHPNGGSSHADRLEALHRKVERLAVSIERQDA